MFGGAASGDSGSRSRRNPRTTRDLKAITRGPRKIFRADAGPDEVTYDPRREMKAEYGALEEFERRGFSSGRYRVARALGTDEAGLRASDPTRGAGLRFNRSLRGCIR